MQNTFKMVLTALAAVVLLCGQAQAAKRYEVKSGYIKYETSHGTDELYWDNYGENEARYTDATITMFGMTQQNRSVNIIDGKWSYNYDDKSKVASKADYEKLMQQMTGNKNQPITDFSEAMIEAYDGEKIGTEKILGKKCTIYNLKSFGDYRGWVYKGLALKAELNMMGFNFNMKAVEFKENAKIDQAKLRLPEGMEIVEAEMPDMPSAEEMQQAREAMQQMQNDPEMQEAMQQLQELQNNPELLKAMQEMKDYQNSPEYKKALQQAAEAQAVQTRQENAAGSENLAEDVGSIIKDETSSAVKSTIRDTTRDVIGGGLKSIFSN